MMRRNRFFTLTTGLFSLMATVAGNPDPVESACGLVGQTVHCYGGGLYQDPTNKVAMLDLSTIDFFGSNLQINWTQEQPNIELQQNNEMSWVTYNNSQGIMFYGGFGSRAAPYNLVNPATVYTTANSWQRVVPTNPYLTDTDIYANEASLVDMTRTGRSQVWIIGGYSNKTLAPLALINPNNISDASRPGVMPIIQIFDYSTLSWLPSPANSLSFNNFTRTGHTSTLSADGSSIFVIGGWRANLANTTQGHKLASVNDIWQFDVNALQWKALTAANPNNTEAVPRWHHSAILVPDTSYILLYGGYAMDTNTFIPVALYEKSSVQTLMIYDTSANAFVLPNVVNPLVLPSAHHSAILYKDPKTSRSVVGYFLASSSSNMPLTYFLDVSNPSQLMWLGNGTNVSSSGGLSTGAIAGISVGAIVATVAACAAVVFYCIRRNRRKQDFLVEASDPRKEPTAERMYLVSNETTTNTTAVTGATTTFGHTRVNTASTDRDTLVTGLSPVKPTFTTPEYKELPGKPSTKPFGYENDMQKPEGTD